MGSVGWGCGQFDLRCRVLAADPFSEFVQGSPESAAGLRQPPGSEEEQQDGEEDREMGRA